MSKSQDTLISEALDKELPQHSSLPKRPFLPWHKPRKQWIRRHQWLKETIELCTQLQFRDDRPLKYLSLPGEDLLDIRVIRECCERLGVKLRYLGLNDSHASDEPNTWLHIACNEVNGLSNIHQDSLVIRDRFERIADQQSQAFRYLTQYGPFDVVNLDLCESISPRNRQVRPNYYAALQSLGNFQIKNRTEPWLLLITSRVGRSRVSEKDMQKLIDCLTKNVFQYADFGERLTRLVPRASAELKEGRGLQPKKVLPREFLALFSAGLAKWLLQLMGSGDPKWGVALQRSYSYRVSGKYPDMVSYAFVLEPFIHGPTDISGLSQKDTVVQEPTYDERSFAIRILTEVDAIEDLDQIMTQKPADKKSAERESEELLASARYSAAEYRVWVRQFG